MELSAEFVCSVDAGTHRGAYCLFKTVLFKGSQRFYRSTARRRDHFYQFVGREVTRYIGERLGVATEFVDGFSWQERERLLDAGEIHAGWICGLPYVLKADRPRPGVELLAAPVMAGARYAGRPVYFSDIVVRSDHPARSFDELRGARWGYNEPRSHSGYEIVRYQLAQRAERASFFSKVVETWLPSPAPPWVVSQRVPAGWRRQLRRIILDMYRETAGRSILRKARMEHLASVSERDYGPIRRMATAAAGAML